MKKLTILFISFIFVLGITTLSKAADLPKPVDKLVKGVKAVVTSPLEIYDHTKASKDSAKRKSIGILKGLIESPFYVVKKAGHGIVDVVTFPIE